MSKKYLDFSGLTAYDIRIKNLIDEKVGYAPGESPDLSDLKRKVDANTTSISKINKELGNVKEVQARHDNSITQLNTTLEEHAERIAQLESGTPGGGDVDSPDIANINATLREHTESIRTINTSIESHADSIRELNETTTKQANQVEALAAKIEENAANISGAAAAASEAINAAQEAKDTATSAQTTATSAQTTANSAKEAAAAAKQTAENEVTARTEADTKLQSQINGKQNNIDSLSADEKNAFLVSLGLGKIGVISQKQNWKSDYSSYTVSDVVKGIIPQYIIDHWISLSSEVKSDGTVYFRFNEETGYFECNDLIDITLNDAINIIQYGQTETFRKNSSGTKKVRVIFCANLNSLWANSSYLGVGLYTERVYCIGILSIPRCFLAILDGYDFITCPRLRDVLYIDLSNNSRTFTFSRLNSLTTFLGVKMRGNFSFKDSPLLSNESILFLINYEEATSAITITLHPDAYARAMANADILAALETHTKVSLASAQ